MPIVRLRDVAEDQAGAGSGFDEREHRPRSVTPPERARLGRRPVDDRVLDRPIPSTSQRTRSPGSRKTGGSRKTPTPDGVPVAMTSPGSRVMTG